MYWRDSTRQPLIKVNDFLILWKDNPMFLLLLVVSASGYGYQDISRGFKELFDRRKCISSANCEIDSKGYAS
jgi:hypothetical protein